MDTIKVCQDYYGFELPSVVTRVNFVSVTKHNIF